MVVIVGEGEEWLVLIADWLDGWLFDWLLCQMISCPSLI